jgi:glycosyltransferase involved in cell wall biosynthesis
LRVHYLIDSLGPGGAEHLLAEYLAVLPGLGVEPVVTAIQERSGNPVAARIAALGIEVETLGIERLRQGDARALVAAAMERARPDLVHTQLEFANILGSWAAGRQGIPVVSTIHTIDRPRRLSRDGLRFRLMAWSLRRRAERVLCVSDGARRHFEAVAGIGRSRASTLHNGIDLAPFAAADPAAGRAVREAHGIPAAAPLATTVAVLRRPKGIQHMLEALPRVLDRVPDAHYLVVGDGPHRAALADQAAALGLVGRVHFVGATDRVPDHLAAADLFVLPSLTEALPTVVIEAMAAGLPVVATAVGGVPEMVDHPGSALLVPPADPVRLAEAVSRVLSSPLQASAMGRSGRRIAAARFDIRRQAGRLLEEYHLAVRRGALR